MSDLRRWHSFEDFSDDVSLFFSVVGPLPYSEDFLDFTASTRLARPSYFPEVIIHDAPPSLDTPKEKRPLLSELDVNLQF